MLGVVALAGAAAAHEASDAAAVAEQRRHLDGCGAPGLGQAFAPIRAMGQRDWRRVVLLIRRQYVVAPVVLLSRGEQGGGPGGEADRSDGLEHTAGHYDPGENVTRMFFPGEGASGQIPGVYAHELTHHWIERRRPGRAGPTDGNDDSDSTPGYWVVEGYADFVKGFVFDVDRLTAKPENPRADYVEVVSGMAEVALGRDEAARGSFERALEADPLLALEPGAVSPKIFRIFEEVRTGPPHASR